MFNFIKSALRKINKEEENIDKEETEAINAIASLLVEAASVDGNIAEEEKDLINSILIKQLNLETDKALILLDKSIIEHSNQIEIWSKTQKIRKEMDYEERLQVLEMLWEIVLADKVVDVYESHLMRRVAGLLYITDFDSGSCKKRVEKKIFS